MNKEVTIVIPHFDTPYPYLSACLKSCIRLGLPIIIVDDKSTPQGLAILQKVLREVGTSNIDVFYSPVKLTAPGAIYKAITLAKTEYVIRVDSDDVLYRLPETTEPDCDVIFRPASAKSLEEVLLRPDLMTGIIYRKTLLQRVYADYEYYLPFAKEIHEDLYHLFKLFLGQRFTAVTDKHLETKGRVYQRVRREGSLSFAVEDLLSVKARRLKTLKLAAMVTGVTEERYEYCAKIIRNAQL